MPANTFINFNSGMLGESLQKGFKGDKGWIELSDWSWDIEAETSFMKGGGSSVGKPTPGTFTFTHYYDTSSPALMNRIVAGTHFDKVELVQLKQTGSGAPEPFIA
ncbi:MAG: type VI secretion system tube protein Hcp, partial [Cyanobacteria bacterium REEB65]|nr:type VI secretion system tube protein Hcp [Cyanobacteria bacterium REEB65]